MHNKLSGRQKYMSKGAIPKEFNTIQFIHGTTMYIYRNEKK